MVNRLLGNAPPDIRTAHESTCRVPYEIVEMIITHLISDLDALKACSLTCRSWCTVVVSHLSVSHLYHTVTLKTESYRPIYNRLDSSYTRDQLWLLSRLHGLGLAPIVKEIRVGQPHHRREGRWFAPQTLGYRGLKCFSAFANVHTLKLQELEIYRFIPGIERYFEHFSPTLRSITLFNPHCTPRQLSHFLSLFSNLDDVEIWGPCTPYPDTTIPDTELVSLSAPKLRGRLTLNRFHWVETWTRLIASCGGLRFRYMDLCSSTDCAPVLLDACAETLETLRFDATGSLGGKWFCMNLPADSS